MSRAKTRKTTQRQAHARRQDNRRPAGSERLSVIRNHEHEADTRRGPAPKKANARKVLRRIARLSRRGNR